MSQQIPQIIVQILEEDTKIQGTVEGCLNMFEKQMQKEPEPVETQYLDVIRNIEHKKKDWILKYMSSPRIVTMGVFYQNYQIFHGNRLYPNSTYYKHPQLSNETNKYLHKIYIDNRNSVTKLDNISAKITFNALTWNNIICLNLYQINNILCWMNWLDLHEMSRVCKQLRSYILNIYNPIQLNEKTWIWWNKNIAKKELHITLVRILKRYQRLKTNKKSKCINLTQYTLKLLKMERTDYYKRLKMYHFESYLCSKHVNSDMINNVLNRMIIKCNKWFKSKEEFEFILFYDINDDEKKGELTWKIYFTLMGVGRAFVIIPDALQMKIKTSVFQLQNSLYHSTDLTKKIRHILCSQVKLLKWTRKLLKIKRRHNRSTYPNNKQPGSI